MVGTISGFLGGLLGIGGGVVIVPALILLFDYFQLLPAGLGTLAALATSLACVICTSAAAAMAQIRAGKVDWKIARYWGPFLVLGSLGAGLVANALPVGVLRGLIGLFLCFVAIVMLTRWKPTPGRSFPGWVGSAAAGGLGGLVSGIAGIGGGNVIVPSLLYFNIPVHRATATSSALGVPIASAGLIGYLLASQPAFRQLDPPVVGLFSALYLPGFLAIALPAILMAPIGVRVAHSLDPQPLRRLFGLMLIFVAARMLYTAWLTLG